MALRAIRGITCATLVARRLTSRSSGRVQRHRPASPGSSAGAPLSSRSVRRLENQLRLPTLLLVALGSLAAGCATSRRDASLVSCLHHLEVRDYSCARVPDGEKIGVTPLKCVAFRADSPAPASACRPSGEAVSPPRSESDPRVGVFGAEWGSLATAVRPNLREVPAGEYQLQVSYTYDHVGGAVCSCVSDVFKVERPFLLAEFQ